MKSELEEVAPGVYRMKYTIEGTIPKADNSQQNLEAERGSDYGDMEGCHEAIAGIWTELHARALAGQDERREARVITPRMVALMMVALKLVREAYKHKGDNIADAHVYLDFAERLSESDPATQETTGARQ